MDWVPTVASRQGARRNENQDRAMVRPTPSGWWLAVFDGVGGAAGGAEAADAATTHLPALLDAGLWGQDLVDALAPRITSGATTMALVRQQHEAWDAVTVGDSHVLVDGVDVSRPQGGRGRPLLEYLGKERPAAQTFDLPTPRRSVLVCSDGVMETGLDHVRWALATVADAEALLDVCPADDDATAILARPAG